MFIPHAVKTIKDGAFRNCAELRTAKLGEGLEEIGYWSFGWCTKLRRLAIPPAVKEIDDTAFKGCSNLTKVVFCNKIEEFVSCNAMRNWWHQGLHKKSLSTHRFIVKCNISHRLSRVRVRCLRDDIYNMLKHIPKLPKGLSDYFDTIHSKLAAYERLIVAHKEALMLLDLAIPNDKIVLHVLSTLL